MKKSAFLNICNGIDGCNLTSTDYERIFDYIEKNAYEIKFESEAIKVRQFDEWRKKGIQHARRPLLAFTTEIKKEMKRVATSRHLAVDKGTNANGLSRSHSAQRLRSVGADTTASLTRPNTFHNGAYGALNSNSNLNSGAHSLGPASHSALNLQIGASPSPSFRNNSNNPVMFAGPSPSFRSHSNMMNPHNVNMSNSASNSVNIPISPNANVHAAAEAAASIPMNFVDEDDGDLGGDTPYGMAINVDNYTTAGFMDDDDMEPSLRQQPHHEMSRNDRLHSEHDATDPLLSGIGGVNVMNGMGTSMRSIRSPDALPPDSGHIPLRHSSEDEEDEITMIMDEDDDDDGGDHVEVDEDQNQIQNQNQDQNEQDMNPLNPNQDMKDQEDKGDQKDLDEEQKEIEAAMRSTFKAHSGASKEIDAAEYHTFCGQLQSTAFWWLGEVATRSTQLALCENSVELGCLLIDNWWPRILDALKIVLELNDDPYVTPLVLSILPYFLQITLTLGAFGHEPCKIAVNGVLSRYKTWWLAAMKRMDEESKKRNGEMATEADLKRIEGAIWGKSQKCYAQLKVEFISEVAMFVNTW